MFGNFVNTIIISQQTQTTNEFTEKKHGPINIKCDLCDIVCVEGVECTESATLTNSSPLVWECGCPAILGRAKLEQAIDQGKSLSR